MKNSILRLLSGLYLLIMIAGCEKELPVYSEPTNRLIFDYYSLSDTLKNYSFIYEADNVTTDTIWYKVHTMGFVTGHDRPFRLQQVMTGEDDATAGVHYVPFDDAELLKKFYYIPANSTVATVPVVVKRDVSLRTQAVQLQFTIKETDEFSVGYSDRSTMTLVIADFLSKPSGWQYMSTHYFGAYGVEKHRFLINTTGDKWDNDFLANELFVEDSSTCDKYYMVYLEGVLRTALDQLNAEREAQGLGKLKEADGTEVSIPLIAL